MGGGGGGNTTSTVTQTNLPSYARPYYEALMKDAQSIVDTPYTTYSGQRIASLNGMTTGAIDDVAGLSGNNATNTAGSKATQDAANGLGELGSYDPSKIANTATFDKAAADKYMSPYVQNVINQQKSGAVTDFQRQAGDRNMAAVRAGALGGSGSAVANYLAEEGLANKLSSIEAEGLQNAYQQAQSQFNTETGAQDAINKANVSNELAGKQLNSSALQAQGNLGNALFQQGSAMTDNALKVAQAKMEGGQYLQDYQQKILDQRYNDFVDQRDYQRNNLNWMSGILHGVPTTANSSVTGQTGNSTVSNAGSILAGLGALSGGK